MTLMPVSNISAVGVRSVTAGASRWIGQRSLTSMSPASSIGSPRRLKMRPSVMSPTGTVIGPPVSRTSVPRSRPSVVSMATARTRSSPRCCCTSHTSTPPPPAPDPPPTPGPGGDALLLAVLLEVDLEGVVDLRQLAVGERGLDDDALYLLDAAGRAGGLLRAVRTLAGAMLLRVLVLAVALLILLLAALALSRC